MYNCRVVDVDGLVKDLDIETNNLIDLKKIITSNEQSLLSYKKNWIFRNHKLSENKILLFTQTLQLLINSNLTLLDSLEISYNSFSDKNLKVFTKNIISSLKTGEKFSLILKKSNAGFPAIYLGLIKVGESTGTLNIVIQQLYYYLDRKKVFKEKLIGALIYPCFILIISIIFSIVFIRVILPKFNEMFLNLGDGIGDLLKRRGSILSIVIFITLIFILILLVIVLYTSKIKKVDYKKSYDMERLYLSIPFIGKLIIDNETFNLVFALSVLTKSSLSLEKSLEYAKDVINNSYLKKEVEIIKRDIISGKKLSLSFTKTLFPIKISSFIKVSEKTGDITSVFENLSNYYLKESEKKIERLMTIIDPLFTLILGSILFSLILLFILPLLTKMGELL